MTKRAERERAREMRAEGASLREIMRELDVSLGSVSVWVRDVPLPVAEARHDPPRPAEPPSVEDPPQQCGGCKATLPADAFNRMGDRRQAYCRGCFRRYYARTRERQLAVNAALKQQRVAEGRALVLAHLAENPCTDCHESDPVVLEFDHVRGEKLLELAQAVAWGTKRERLVAEIAKCDVVCVACHRYRTAIRADWRRIHPEYCRRPWRSKEIKRNTLHMYAALRTSGCVDCGEEDIVLLDFDHRGGKLARVPQLVNEGASLRRLQEEIDRCDVRCVICHRRRTATTLGHYRTLTS